MAVFYPADGAHLNVLFNTTKARTPSVLQPCNLGALAQAIAPNRVFAVQMISLATAAFAFSGRQLADDDHDGHDHGGGSAAPAAGCTVAYEWGGIFAMPSAAGTYSYTVYKKDGAWAEPSMKVVFLPVTDTSQATLNAQIEVAHEAFEHHCGADELVDVEPGQTIIPGDHRCSKLHIEGDAASIQYTIRLTDAKNAAVTNLAIFTERTLKPVDMAAALASGSTTRPPLPQPWASALSLLLGSGLSPFEATASPPKAAPRLRICASIRSQITPASSRSHHTNPNPISPP